MSPEQQDRTYQAIDVMREIADKIAAGADMPNPNASEFYQKVRERIKTDGIRAVITSGEFGYLQGLRDRMRVPRKRK
jgi:hypothetical protein